jgi:hypothetical protein
MVDQRLLVSEPPFMALVMIYVLSLGLAAGQVFQLVLRARACAPRLDRLGVVVGLLFACLVALETVHESEVWLDRIWQIPLALLIYGLTAIVPYAHWWLSRRHAQLRTWSMYMLRGTLVVFCVTAAAWAWDRYHQLNAACVELGLLVEAPGQAITVDRYCAVTDAGRRVPLYRWSVTDERFREFSERAALQHALLSDDAIPREMPDYHTNCHGWVFADGRFLIRGPDVEQILQDNGYAITDTPLPGDVIIYRSETGEILHTGLVRGLLSDRTVIVESKFGVGGRYLHQPEGQPFAQQWAYYHTARRGHGVTIERASRSQVSTPSSSRSGHS